MKVEQRIITADEHDVRLDRWFARHFPQLTHGRLEKLLRTGQVRVDGKRADGKTRLTEGQTIRIPPLPPVDETAKPKKEIFISKTTASQLKAAILYDDDDVIVLNKPAGLAVQGGTGQRESLDDWLHVLKQGDEKPKLVHRLDKETSGVLVIARNSYAAAKLASEFRNRTTKKYYLAVLQSCPRVRKGMIEAPLFKTSTGKVIVDAERGEGAVTSYRTLVKAKNGQTLVLLQPHTGRTHQLRAHMLHLGTPILGDPIYNDDKSVKGLHLHSARLVIPHPREHYGFLDVAAPLPDMQAQTYEALGFDTQRDWTEEE